MRSYSDAEWERGMAAKEEAGEDICEVCGCIPSEHPPLYTTIGKLESGPLCSMECVKVWRRKACEPSAEAQDLINEVAPRLDAAVKALRKIDEWFGLGGDLRVSILAQIDELAQLSTTLNLASTDTEES